jgi:hypothetical protein
VFSKYKQEEKMVGEKVKLWLIMAIAMIFCFTVGNTTMVEQLSEQELVDDAEIICFGQVVDVKCEWNFEHTQIYTKINISIEDMIKGSINNESIELVVLGGTVGDTTLWIVDSPNYVKQQEVLMFLTKRYSPIYQVVGFNQGKMTIETDKSSGEKIIIERHQPLDEFIEIINTLDNNRKGGGN